MARGAGTLRPVHDAIPNPTTAPVAPRRLRSTTTLTATQRQIAKHRVTTHDVLFGSSATRVLSVR